MTPAVRDLLDVARLKADQLARLLAKLPPGFLGDDGECLRAAEAIRAVIEGARKGGRDNG